ncbi:hypothetical protein [Mycobacterium sp. NAZ190054]|uniref:hypothetical protein n=1 Tax=Mycobacterium sp. NAZ190054 TaxID=1747766 RepID=UPI00079C1E1A|nr:hypothetical protein [Mycobacterium sp. NAZ190054]KWX66000.1 hypothetical protein ASJ79_07020 [Mycobacterium sp. NAZ190054]
MSWLLVALIPGLLMLATFGLERVEAGLRCDADSSADVDEFLQQANAGATDSPARAGTDRALRTAPRRIEPRDTPTDGFLEPVSAPGLPTTEYCHRIPNSEFRETRHADRV